MTMMIAPPSSSSPNSAGAIDLLRKACTSNDLSSSTSLSDDGKILTLYESSYDATSLQTITVVVLRDGKSSSSISGGGTTSTKDVTYSLASIYLQLIYPVGVLPYRKACDNYNVDDPVKVLDKACITDYFLKRNNEELLSTAIDAEDDHPTVKRDHGDDMDLSGDEAAAVVAASSSSSRRKNEDGPLSGAGGSRHRKPRGRDKQDGSKHHSKSSSLLRDEDDNDRRGSSSKGKAPKGPITNEQLVANLSTIVDKRDTAAANLVVVDTPTKVKVARMSSKDDENNDATAINTTATATGFTPTLANTPMLSDDELGGFSQTIDEAEKKKNIGTTDNDRDLLLAWLSPEGFQVDSSSAVSAAIEADREAVRRITALEIPVGDSASILRAGAGGEIVVEKGGTEVAGGVPGGGGINVKKRDFARVLEIYQEVVAAEEGAKRLSTSSGGKRPPPPTPAQSSMLPSKSPQLSGPSGGAATSGGTSSTKPGNSNPIIVVPNAMTSAITMINAGLFLGKDSVFIPRDQAVQNPSAGKRGGTISITRKLAPRLGGADITYDIIDNPVTRLKKDDWNRVVAVICQGAAWQFKGWRYSDPVDLFSRTFGFYVGLEGAAVPNELRGWNVKTGKVSRDRRGLDSVCLASFWNGLEEFMAVHKQDIIKVS